MPNPSGRPTDEGIYERVIELSRDNVRPKEIADILKISERTVHRYRRRAGFPTQPSEPWTAEDQRRADMLFDDGCSLNEVARTLGRTDTVIKRHCPGRKWTREQEKEWMSKPYRTLRRQLGLTEDQCRV